MKIVKTASGKKLLKISRQEWLSIGRKKRWTKSAQNDDSKPVSFYDSQYPFSAEEEASRIKAKVESMGGTVKTEKATESGGIKLVCIIPHEGVSPLGSENVFGK